MSILYLFVAFAFFVLVILALAFLNTSYESELPGEFENPWIDLKLSELNFTKRGTLLAIEIRVEEEERTCLEVQTKYDEDELLINVRKAEVPKFSGFLYTQTNDIGRYTTTVPLKKGCKKASYGPEKQTVWNE